MKDASSPFSDVAIPENERSMTKRKILLKLQALILIIDELQILVESLGAQSLPPMEGRD